MKTVRISGSLIIQTSSKVHFALANAPGANGPMYTYIYIYMFFFKVMALHPKRRTYAFQNTILVLIKQTRLDLGH